ncbi:MAG: hypothetical protein LBP75_02645 [Planctomycetota bacterium]|nr:hypothetical protein [Planctomycetota bacterium]
MSITVGKKTVRPKLKMRQIQVWQTVTTAKIFAGFGVSCDGGEQMRKEQLRITKS